MRDLIALADKTFAEISSDGQSGKPLWPCATCGKETLEHTRDPKTNAERRICCMSQCPARLAMLKDREPQIIAAEDVGVLDVGTLNLK